jgi:hypothetical protein
MTTINAKNIKENWGSVRLTAFLTPDTFTRKIIVIDTTIHGRTGKGETAIKQGTGLNYFDLDLLTKGIWKVLKHHKTMKEAIDFHIKTINEKNFADCEVVK